MRSADGAVRRAVALACAMALAVVAQACADGLAPLTSAGAPQALTARALRAGAVTLTWKAITPASGVISAYIIERRRDATGAFEEVTRVAPPFLPTMQWIDTDVAPETIYGYRVIAVTSLGDRSPPSVVGGVITPPPPGLLIRTNTPATAPEALDPDGYDVTITGPETRRSAIGVSETRRFAPLAPGTYTITLAGLVDRCSADNASRTMTVSDTTAETLVPVTFNITCRDPNRGDLKVAVAQTGGALDPEIAVDILGAASDSTLPVSERVFSAQRTVTIASPGVTFTNVRPGSYTATIRGIASNCTLSGSASRTVSVTKLGSAVVTFDVACRDTAAVGPINAGPFVWRNTWSPRTASTGSSVTLESTLDLTARPGQNVKGVQATISYDPAVLRFEAEDATQLTQLTVNSSTPGLINVLAATTGAAKVGVVSLFKLGFTVIGATNAKTFTRARDVKASSQVGTSSAVPFGDSVRVVEDTFTVGTAASPGVINQVPIARAGGPYTGTVGTPVNFTAAASTDADGTIASYAWTFGDNTSGTGVSPTKTYSAPGTYTATLTVTDNKGATGTATTQVTITAATPAPSSPVAQANGPYVATVGVPLTLSAAGSTNAVTYAWALGNGQTASGIAPSVTYASAGTYTLTLTVTAAGGQTATATTSVTVQAPAPAPGKLEWKVLFGPVDLVNNSVAITLLYDTRVNLDATPGPEALERFAVDSLKWDPSVLQFMSVNLGPNIVGTSNQVGATAGRLGLTGVISGAQQQGLITIATIRFRPVGARGATTTTRTYLGALLGPSSTNFFSYNSSTTITEGTFTVP